jgi:hypothetical protein
MPAPMSCPSDMSNNDELLKMRKFLDDADYWDHRRCPPPVIRKRSQLEDYPLAVFDTLSGDVDQANDRLPLSSKSESEDEDKSRPTPKRRKSLLKSNTKSQSALKSESKEEDKENQTVSCEF